jgi:hypothetical protein
MWAELPHLRIFPACPCAPTYRPSLGRPVHLGRHCLRISACLFTRPRLSDEPISTQRSFPLGQRSAKQLSILASGITFCSANALMAPSPQRGLRHGIGALPPTGKWLSHECWQADDRDAILNSFLIEGLNMPILLVQIPTNVPSFDESRYPDREDSLILDHLVQYCRKFDPLPAITIKVEGASAIVVHGHKYLVVARILERRQIRAVITSPPSSPEVLAFLAREDVVRLNWEEIRASEDAVLTLRAWHVFFFERSLSMGDRKDFESRVARLFAGVLEGATVQVHYDDVRRMAEFEVPTPVTDEAWAAESLATLSAFSRERVPILSYQGRRFPG